MYVITAEVKYSDNSDYVKSFLSYDEYADWGWDVESADFFSSLEDAETEELAVINGDNPVNSYYVDVKNITIQRVESFDIS